MPSALASLAQPNFASGMWRSVARHLIPEHGAWELQNYLLDEDGSPYRRGGSEYLSTGAFGTSLRFIWDGNLTPGARTVIANPNDFGVLDGAEAPINLGLAGLTAPKRAAELAGVLFIGGGTLYAGSRKTAVYSTGTVSVTNGSKTVTGSGTTWNTLVDVGMLFRVADRAYVVASVDSVTQITLRDAYEGSTAAGQAYTLNPIYTAAAPYRTSDLYVVAGDRLWSLEGDTAYFSAYKNPHSFNTVEEFHRIPHGAQLLGGAELGDAVVLFSTAGVHLVSGIRLDLTDPDGNVQHRVQHVSEDLILWGHEGIATWAGALVAPCADGVWLVDGISAPVKLSRSVDLLYRAYVQAGHRPGLAAVIRGHYLLPILDGSGAVVDQLVCRVDRPVGVRGVGTIYPWTRLAGFSGRVPAWAVRTGSGSAARNPFLLGASQDASARVVKANGFFGPDVIHKDEPDGSVHETDLISRDYPTGDGRTSNMVRRLKVRYELTDLASDNPFISAYWSDGAVDTAGVSLWGTMVWGDVWAAEGAGQWQQLAGQAPEDDGRHPFPWEITKRVRFLRIRLRSSSASSKMVIRTMELLVRPTGKR